MADKRINELEEALSITAADLFVLQQANTAKKLSGQTMTNFLLALANGHGGISSIDKTSSSATDPVVDTYTVTFADQTTTTFEVTNGAKGNTGARGPQGPKGDDVTIASTSVMYQAWTSGTQYPTGTWVDNPPTVTPGNYLWTRTIVNYSDGEQTVSYSVARWGIDGSGAVASVNGNPPDQNGNVALTASDVGALPDNYQAPVASVNNKTGTVVLDNEDLKAKYAQSVSASLSSAGWYRAVKYTASNANDANGYSGAIVHLDLSRSYVNTANEVHSIDLALVNGYIKFVGEKSVSNSLGIDKVRYTKNGSVGYVDVHYKLANANKVSVAFIVGADETEQQKFTAETLQSVNDAPSGETIVTTYELSENGIRKVDITLTSGTAVTLWGGCWVTKITDNLCLLHLAIDGLTANSNNYPCSVPAGYRPLLPSAAVCSSKADMSKTAIMYVEKYDSQFAGTVRINPQDSSVLCEIIYVSE